MELLITMLIITAIMIGGAVIITGIAHLFMKIGASELMAWIMAVAIILIFVK